MASELKFLSAPSELQTSSAARDQLLREDHEAKYIESATTYKTNLFLKCATEMAITAFTS